jgi:hypothetical protein
MHYRMVEFWLGQVEAEEHLGIAWTKKERPKGLASLMGMYKKPFLIKKNYLFK